MINDDLVYKLIGEKIKEHRTKKSLTQEDLAKELDASRASMVNYESGEQAIYISDLFQLADFFRVDIKDLLPTLKEVKEKSTPKLILKKDKKLGNKERRELYKFIKKYSIKEA